MSMMLISEKTYKRVEQYIADLKSDIEDLKEELREAQEVIEWA